MEEHEVVNILNPLSSGNEKGVTDSDTNKCHLDMPIEEMEISDYGRTGPNLLMLIPVIALIIIMLLVVVLIAFLYTWSPHYFQWG